MRLGTLCSGIDAVALAATWLNWEILFQCEIDPFCIEVLSQRFKNVPKYGNIKEFDGKQWRGTLDVLVAGFPCQPFSVAGQRQGTNDDRYLWPDVFRIIDESRPAWFIGENVAGITTMVQPGTSSTVASQTNLLGETEEIIEEEYAYVLETICSDLERIGYSVIPFIVPAAAVGAPHKRDRIFIVAYSDESRVEGVQQEGKKRIYGLESVANAKCKRFQRGGGAINSNRHTFDLNDLAKNALLPTPASRDVRGANNLESTKRKIKQGKRAHMGQLPNCVAVTTGKTSQLNHQFVMEMMGFPVDWCNIPTESIQSLGKKPSKQAVTL